MEEADQLCDRIAIVDHGRIVALDTPTRLKQTIGANEVVRLEVRAADGGTLDGRLVGRLSRAGDVVLREPGADGAEAITIHCRSARAFVPAAFDAARAENARIDHVEVVPVTLEDVFISLTGRGLRE